MPPTYPPTASSDDQPDYNLLWFALNQSPGGLIVYEAIPGTGAVPESLRVVLANEYIARLTGIGQASLPGQSMASLFPDWSSTELWPQLIGGVRPGGAHRQQLFYAGQQGRQPVWFALSISPVGDGKRAVLSLTDVTSLHEAQEQMLSNTLLFNALSSTVPEVGVLVTDYFKKVTIATGTLPGLLATTNPEQLIGTALETHVLPDFWEDWRNYLGTALAGESHFFSDHWGGWRCEVYIGPVRNEQGNVVMILVVFRNVTEQYRQQQALIQSNSALKQSNQNLEQFAYVASHDLQAPLRKIRSFGDLLKNSYEQTLGADGAELIERMQGAGERMSTLIESLLTYARLGNEQRPQDMVHMGDLFNELVADLSVLIQERNGVVRLQPPLPIIPGDGQQLRQLFQNLLTNALKFVPTDRTPLITITARVVEGPGVPDLATSADSIYAELVIKDNGIGIAPANYDKIFGLFNRLHGQKQFTGSGIGLATVKKVVDNHQGSITLKSQLGEGTEFRVYLPISR